MMRENIAGEARPVRIVANSSLANSTARSILSSASKRASSITWSVASFGAGSALGWVSAVDAGAVAVARGFDRVSSGGRDQGSDLLAEYGSRDGVLALGAEHEHGKAVLHAETERGGINDPEPSFDRLVEGYGV